MPRVLTPNIIDIEASGFGAHSYPIEIGVITSNNERYCALIQPLADWTHWREDAQAIHGIARELLLEKGRPARQICIELNELLGDSTCYSDAWCHDSSWLSKLFFAGRTRPSFRLSPIELIASEDQLRLWDKAKQTIADEFSIRRHRASNDAFLIQQTFKKTLEQLQLTPKTKA